MIFYPEVIDRMDKPSIDNLLENVHGMYELAAVAGKRAIEIKKIDKGNAQPLQQALDEIREGNVDFDYKKHVESESVDGEQIELPLAMDAKQAKLETTISGETAVAELVESNEEITDERQTDDGDEMGPEIGVLEDDYPPKILEGDILPNDEE